jgi:hypothetical protein
MSLGPAIDRRGPSADPKETWVPVPGKPGLERNLETPPKLRTKGYQPPAKVWPFPTHPPAAPIIEDTEDEPTWGIVP